MITQKLNKKNLLDMLDKTDETIYDINEICHDGSCSCDCTRCDGQWIIITAKGYFKK